MTYVIAQPCVDVMDRACVDECPVDCIYEDDSPGQWAPYLADNEAFFALALPGRDDAVSSPGGAASIGPLGVDTPLVGGLPPQSTPDAAG